ncbi:hypothetical protein R1sor_012033 [Riccia sorocarpa]|uniref:Reverse transcriptase domain-containing protein n=1 Tax=Riccia sorocarpa TaxID=122646 RepID=A0ABD3I5C4_9MARC
MPLDMAIARRTLGILSKAGLLLFTAEEAPSPDKVIRWVEEVIIQKMGIQVRMIRSLARKHFLEVVGDEDQRDYIMKNPPGRMEGKMIQISRWTPGYNYKEASMSSKQVWVELSFVDPMIVDQGHKMLAKLGPILYYAVVRKNETKYSHIRGCVLMHNLDNLYDSISLELPWGGEYLQEVEYTGLPDQCHKCSQRGHWAADCANKPGGRHSPSSGAGASSAGLARGLGTPSPSPVIQTDKSGDPFTPVGRRGEKAWRVVDPNTSGGRGNSSQNIYGVLENEEEAENDGTPGTVAPEQIIPPNTGDITTDGPKTTSTENVETENQITEPEEEVDEVMLDPSDLREGDKNEVDQTGGVVVTGLPLVCGQQTVLNFDMNVVMGEDEYHGVDAESNQETTVEFQVTNDENTGKAASVEAFDNNHLEVPATRELERVPGEELGKDLSQNNQKGDNAETQENETHTEEAAKEGNQCQAGTQIALLGRGYYPRPRFVTAPITRQSQKDRGEASMIITQVTPERRAVEKRRTLENREPLHLRAEFMDVRSRNRKQPQTGEHNFLSSFPTGDIDADLSVLIPTNFRTDEAVEWIHRLEPWRGESRRPQIRGWDPFIIQDAEADQGLQQPPCYHNPELPMAEDDTMDGQDEERGHAHLEMVSTGHTVPVDLDVAGRMEDAGHLLPEEVDEEELKVKDQRKLENSLRALMPEGRVIVDYTSSGRGGCALLISVKLRVSNFGISGFGGAAWATVHAANGSVTMASLHAPNTKEERQLYWDWWDRQVDGEDWILADDFNNVELQDDSKGKSALIRGAEERTWRRFMNRTDMIDAYLTAVKTVGGLYTRMAFCGERFDRARLDRFYLSNRGEWCEQINQVEHHSGQLLSDHIPIALELQLVQNDDSNWRPRSYFKMNRALLERPGVLQNLKELWGDHPVFCRSIQKKWELAWGRIKQALKEEKEKERAEGRDSEDTKREVEELRIRAESEELSTEAKEILRFKEDELRNQELKDARRWKCRSREKWLQEGEAPSRYFYSQLKAKFSRERLTVLETEDGSMTTDHKRIIGAVEAYYKELYTRETGTQEVEQARDEVLSYLTRRITREEDGSLHEAPTEKEIDEVVADLKAGKSPGLDGLTAETLHSCWSFVRRDCIDMVQEFWSRGALTEKTRTAVIKLLPKNEDTQLLKNWRPLSLMGITYKILAKTMANKIKNLMPKLVDNLQTGFIEGRTIASNLLSLKLGQDWTRLSDQECVFVQLDFVKAYDRLEHGFLWRTLASMGFSEATLKIIKGLAQGGLAMVHLNEDFTQSFPIQRGVRQGCPLAPYLFTLTTQVFMDTIQAGVNDGSIRGLKINDQQQLVHRLFADDTGLFLEMEEEVFRAARDKIAMFETASGALLNLQKSIIIPMGHKSETALPILDFGGQGVLSLPQEIGSSIWDYYLDLTSILRALPRYTLLSLGLDKGGIKELETITRQFLWGWSQEGKEKKSLLAWDVFSKPKAEGGLGWGRLETMADAHLLRNLLSVMQSEPDIWTSILQQFIRDKTRRRRVAQEIQSWSPQEILLGLKSMNIPDSDLANRMLKVWYRVKKQLRWVPGVSNYPRDLTLRKIQFMLEQYVGWPQSEIILLMKTLKRGRYVNGYSLNTMAGDRLSLGTYLGEQQVEMTGPVRAVVAKFDSVFPPDLAQAINLHESSGWRWAAANDDRRSAWFPTTKLLKKMLTRHKHESPTLTSRWGRSESQEEQTTRWRTLWNAKMSSRSKVRLWRFLRRAYFTNSRAREMQLSAGECLRCRGTLETYTHALWECSKTRERTRWISEILAGVTEARGRPRTGIERNGRQFKGTNECLPRRVILADVKREIEAISRSVDYNANWDEVLDKARRSIEEWTSSISTGADLAVAEHENNGTEGDYYVHDALRSADRDDSGTGSESNHPEDGMALPVLDLGRLLLYYDNEGTEIER